MSIFKRKPDHIVTLIKNNSQHKHVSIDIETLGISADATITEIALTFFSPGYGIGDEYVYSVGDTISWDVEWVTQNRNIDAATVKWVLQQAVLAANIVKTDRTDLVDILSLITRLVNKHFVWAKGPDFDLVLLTNAFKQHNQEVPWMYYNGRDVRTEFHRNAEARKKWNIKNESPHTAKGDSLYQAKVLSLCLGNTNE